MTTGGQDPNQNPERGPGPEGTPPPGNYPPPQGPGSGYPPPPGNYPPPQGPGGGYPPPPGNYPPPQGPGGGYPPPPGNYPPPAGPGGGYPPPPGNYPPPPPAYDSGYGRSPAGPPPSEVSVGAALSYGWNKFKNNPGVWIGALVVAAVISILVSLPFSVGGNRDFDSFSDLSASFSLWQIIGNIVTAIVSYLISAALIRGALHEVDGRRPQFASFFEFRNVGAIIIASFLVGLMTGIGFVLLVIPGLVLMFLTWWTLEFVVDQDQDAITAIKSSFRAISSNWGTLLGLAVTLFFLNVLGTLLCLVGLLVTIPVSIIASTYAYRVTVRGPVAP